MGPPAGRRAGSAAHARPSTVLRGLGHGEFDRRAGKEAFGRSPLPGSRATPIFPNVERSPDKVDVARALREIAVLLQVKGESSFKSRAYDIAADRISGLTGDLGELVRQRRLRELPGIGEALEEKITELVTTGRLPYLEDLRASYPPGLLQLMNVPDLGPKKAALLWRELQIG